MERFKHILWLVVSLGLIGQQTVLKALGIHLGPGWEALVPGLAIFGAAFMLSWAAELAQMEIPQTLALAFLALIAVLPEYAVDLYFAWSAGTDPKYIHYATANMTGANRLLIGLGWPVVLFAYWFATKKKHIDLEPGHRIELFALLAATFYSFFIPIKGSIQLIDSVVLLAIFIFYIIAASKAHHVEPELEGPVELFSKGSRLYRCIVTLAFFAISGFTIYISAEPFAEGLIASGKTWGVDEFILVQWLAPLASESPEFIVAIIFATRAMAGASLGTLISSKVNQWTLLIASLPIAYTLAGGSIWGMELDKQQIEEIFLTAGQSLFAIFILSNFRFSMLEAFALLILFSTQLVIPLLFPSIFPNMPEADLKALEIKARLFYGGFYIALSILMIMLSHNRRNAILSLIRPKRK
ncbi:MAG: sodium:calcium antiporter [Planctomycetes bacterium]|nr:sodium:calcium antiporter [Planctomycetota bacterium]